MIEIFATFSVLSVLGLLGCWVPRHRQDLWTDRFYVSLPMWLKKPLYASAVGFTRRWRELAERLPMHEGTIVRGALVSVQHFSTGASRVALGEAKALRVRLDDGSLVDVPVAEASPRDALEVGARVKLLGTVESGAGEGYRDQIGVIAGACAIKAG